MRSANRSRGWSWYPVATYVLNASKRSCELDVRRVVADRAGVSANSGELVSGRVDVARSAPSRGAASAGTLVSNARSCSSSSRSTIAASRSRSAATDATRTRTSTLGSRSTASPGVCASNARSMAIASASRDASRSATRASKASRCDGARTHQESLRILCGAVMALDRARREERRPRYVTPTTTSTLRSTTTPASAGRVTNSTKVVSAMSGSVTKVRSVPSPSRGGPLGCSPLVS